jgi:hypothetical protein
MLLDFLVQHIQSVYQEILETGGTIGKEDTTIEWILEETVLQSSSKTERVNSPGHTTLRTFFSALVA